MRQGLTLLASIGKYLGEHSKAPSNTVSSVSVLAHRLQWDSSQSIFVPIVKLPTSNDAFLLKSNVLSAERRKSRQNETQKENERKIRMKFTIKYRSTTIARTRARIQSTKRNRLWRSGLFGKKVLQSETRRDVESAETEQKKIVSAKLLPDTD